MLTEEHLNFLPYFFTDPVFIVKEKQQPETDEERQPQGKGDSPQPKTVPKLSPIPYQGKNLKKILILFQNEKAENLPERTEVFLGKVLHAVRLNFDDVALVNINLVPPSDYDQLNHFDARLWLSFGIKHEALLIDRNFPLYNIRETNNISLLLTDPLETIENNKDKKVLLWNNLKTLFP